jgi:hypothetical protein
VGYRRSPDRITAARAWRNFIDYNARVISAAGLPRTATVTVASWDHFLVHGHLAGEPAGFTVDELTDAQYSLLVEFVSNYFGAGYEFFTPLALRVEDQLRLRARFDGPDQGPQ